MTAAERKAKIDKLKSRMADRCVDISITANELRKAESTEMMLKLCRRIDDHIAEIRRTSRTIEDLEYTEVE